MDNNALARLQKLTRESPTVYAVEISCDGEATIDALWETRAAAEIHRDWHNSMKGNRRGFYGRARVVEMKICSEDVAREFYVRNAPAQETSTAPSSDLDYDEASGSVRVKPEAMQRWVREALTSRGMHPNCTPPCPMCDGEETKSCKHEIAASQSEARRYCVKCGQQF